MEAGYVARAKTDPGSAASDVIGAEVSGGTLAVSPAGAQASAELIGEALS